jgi:DNA-binding CsgD family transcriptional regulator
MADHVRAQDVRRLFRLIEECRELRAGGEPVTSHFIKGLAVLTRSSVGIQANAAVGGLNAPPRILEINDYGWSTASDRDRVYQFVTNTALGADPLQAAVFTSNAPIVTLTRADAMSNSAWTMTEARNDVHRPSGIDDSLLSLCRRSERDVRVLVFKRSWGEPPYVDEDRALVDLAHHECGWVFDGAPAASMALAGDFTPRERETLELLFTGASEKSVAASLGLSPHTVHDYVKAIYRKIGVASRAELMALGLGRPER